MPRINDLKQLTKVAIRLGPLCEKVVFLGGVVTPLLVTDLGAADPRPTLDVDVIVEVATVADYYRLGEDLRNRGFKEDCSTGSPICRWVVDGIVVDVMPTGAGILGFANRWYDEAFKSAPLFWLGDNLELRLISAPCFIATKLEAFNGRGANDFLGSRDMEDIITVIDGRLELFDEIRVCSTELRDYLSSEFRSMLQDESFIQCVSGHLPPDAASQARSKTALARVRKIAGLSQ
ncbi:MAG: hypothetical protein WC889_07835 [Myxococcota bacterium]|jgi:predicted nucleotidyltransferase